MPSGFQQGRRCLIAISILLTSSAQAATYNECLTEQARTADKSLTLQQIRENCTQTLKNQAVEDPVANRRDQERESLYNRFTIIPHRPNYVLPVSYNSSPNQAPYKDKAWNEDYSNTEIKFQISMKAPLSYGVFNGYGDLWVAYTNTSWWQAYNNNSAPFRETNHEPEMFFSFPTQEQFMGMNMDMVLVGLVHQSNGQSGSLSRSWNRLYANFIFTKDNFILSAKPWWRLPEENTKYDMDGNLANPGGDDNPDINEYMGYGELSFGYKFDRHAIGVMLRNNLRKDNKGAVQLDWSFPINERFRGYVQYFNGYGESLIDYNASTNRLSVGVMLTDWL